MVTWGSAIRSRGRGACPLTPLNWNPHSLLQINPTPTPWPSTQLTLVYTHYVYPPREEERDSKMDGFKLDIFYREAGINRSTGELAAPRLAEHKKLSGLIHMILINQVFSINHTIQQYGEKMSIKWSTRPPSFDYVMDSSLFMKTLHKLLHINMNPRIYLNQCSLASFLVGLSLEEGQFEQVCPKVLVIM